MADDVLNLMCEVLDSPHVSNITAPGTDMEFGQANFQMMQDVYQACMAEDALKSLGTTPLEDILNDIKAHYPVNASKNCANSELTDLLLLLFQQYALDPLVGTGTDADDRNPDVMAVFLGPGRIGLPGRPYYNKTDVIANYTTTISQMFSIVLGNSTNYDEFSKNVMDIEHEMVNALFDSARASGATVSLPHLLL